MADWTPALRATLEWYDAADASTITQSGGAVSQWDSKGSGGNDLVQATGANQPITNSRTINSKNAIDLNGTSHHMTTSFGSIKAQPVTRFIVLKSDVSDINLHVLLDGIDATDRNVFWLNNIPYWVTFAGVNLPGSTTPDTSAHVFTEILNSSSSALYQDGTSIASGDAGTAGAAGITLGARYTKTERFWDGLVAEVIVVSGTLSEAERQQIEGYLAWKWGTQASLPSGHRYYNGAPQTEYTWDGGGADDNWATQNNWSTNVAPIGGESLIFAGTTRLTPNNNIAADTSFTNITFNSGAGAFTIGGNRITLATNITNNDNSLQTISLDIILTSGQRSFYCTSGDMTISGIISGSGGLDTYGPYLLTLSGLNTFTGYIWIRSGTTSVSTIGNSGVASGLGAQTTVYDLTIWMGDSTATGTLKYTGSGHTSNREINLYGSTGGGTFEHSGSGTLTISGNLTVEFAGAKTLTLKGSTSSAGVLSGTLPNGAGTLAVTKEGTGTWTISGTNTYTGATTVSAGTLLVNGTSAAGSAVSVTGTLGGTGTINGAITVNNTGKIAPGLAGVAIGQLTTAGVTFNSTSTYSVDLNGTTPTFDKIQSSGTVALGSAANTLTVADIINSVNGKVFTIIAATTLSGTFNGKAEGSSFVVGGRTLRISYLSNNCTLTDITSAGSWFLLARKNEVHESSQNINGMR